MSSPDPVYKVLTDDGLGCPELEYMDYDVHIYFRYQDASGSRKQFAALSMGSLDLHVRTKVNDVWFVDGLIAAIRISEPGQNVVKLYDCYPTHVMRNHMRTIIVEYVGAEGEYMEPRPGKPRIINNEFLKKHDKRKPIIITIIMRAPDK